MSISKLINDPKRASTIDFFIFGRSGFSCHFKSSPSSSSVLSGYDDPTEADFKALDKGGFRYLAYSEQAASAVGSFPLVGAADMREGPIGSFTRVPFEVYASLASALGSKIGGVKTIRFIPEMFVSPSDARLKLVSRIIRGDTQAVGDAIFGSLFSKSDSFSIPDGKEYELFAKLSDNLSKETSAINKRYESAAASHKGLKYDDPGYMDSFCQKEALSIAAKHISSIINIVAWNALMVKAGNISPEVAFNDISVFNDNLYAEFSAVFAGDEADRMKHYVEANASDLIPNIKSIVDKYSAAAIKVISTDRASSNNQNEGPSI